MIAACAGILVQAWGRADREPFIPRAAIGPVLKVLGPAVGFVLVMQFLGMYAASAIYMALYMRWIGRYSWTPVVLVSVAFPVITFWVFELWFLVPMPKGPLEAWLGY